MNSQTRRGAKTKPMQRTHRPDQNDYCFKLVGTDVIELGRDVVPEPARIFADSIDRDETDDNDQSQHD